MKISSIQSRNRFEKADYLTHTGIYEYVLEGSRAREVASFMTLFRPFDFFTWIYVMAATIMVSSLLFQMDKCWIRLHPDKSQFIENNKYRGGVFTHDMYMYRAENRGVMVLAPKVAFSWPSVDRFAKNLGDL